MRAYNIIVMLACLCFVLMTTMLLYLRYNDFADGGTRTGFGNSFPSQNMLIKMGLCRDGNGKKCKPLTQSESCRKNCDVSLPISTSGKLPTWATRNLLNNTKSSKRMAFRQIVSSIEYEVLIELLTVFRNICEKGSLMYMLYGGTLLGSYRHFGLIPWDDDVDILVNSSDRLIFKTLLSRVPGFSLHAPPGRIWKFFKPSASRPIDSSNKSKWPFIDIFFFDENSTHVWDDNPILSATYCFDKNDVFPLKYMQFENSLYPVPRHTRTFLDTTLNVDLCVTSPFSHRHERVSKQPQVSLPCRLLFKYYPFVFRLCGRGYSFEQLVIGDTSLYEVLLKC